MSTTFDNIIQNFPEVMERVLKTEMINASELSRKMGKHRSTISRYLNAEKDIQPNKKSIREINSALTRVQIVEMDGGWVLESIQKDNKSTTPADNLVKQDEVSYRVASEKEEVLKQILYARKLLDEAMEILLGGFPGSNRDADQEKE